MGGDKVIVWQVLRGQLLHITNVLKDMVKISDNEILGPVLLMPFPPQLPSDWIE